MSALAETGLELAACGPLDALDEARERRLLDRGRATDPEVARTVGRIIERVRAGGDAALRALARELDGADLEAIEVPAQVCRAAVQRLDPDVRAALEQAAGAIADFHRAQLPAPLEVEVRPGIRLGRRAEPLTAVGVYAPGGRAAYPSSVLMGVVPARVAGVGRIAVCSPPGPSGRPADVVLAACAIGGADQVFAVGGAGAIAAMALGTTSVPRVDRIVGPGNAWVTEAKRQLVGPVGIDCPAGPSEVLVIADDTADPDLVAVEMMAQAEHDPDAAAVLITTDESIARETIARLAARLPEQPRADVIRASLAGSGAVLWCDTLEDAVRFATRYAPEHLLLLVRDARAALERVRCAGTIFLGAPSSVAFGDYLTGANHVLPTAGLARAWAGLSTLDFVRWTTYQELDPGAAARLAGPTAVLAEAEGLPGHAAAARLRARSGLPPAERRWPQRPAYRSLARYEPGRQPTEVDLSDNTDLFGPPPAVASLLTGLAPALITRYPTPYASALKSALAVRHGVDPACITTGCGSDDLIDSALRAFCEPGDAVAFPWPTFGIVPDFARMNAAVPVPVGLGPGFALDAGALVAARGAVTYVCRPNNPTGTAFERAELARLIDDAAGVVLVDEAYADFADDDALPLALASRNAVVVRTFSKAWGLAGLRIGYAIGPAPLVAEIEKSRGPFKVGAVAEAAALAVLSAGVEGVGERVAEVRRNRIRLAKRLAAQNARTWPSAANFLLVAAPLGAVATATALRTRGVAVRPFPSLPGGGDCIRVGIGPWPLMQRFLDVWTAVHADESARAS